MPTRKLNKKGHEKLKQFLSDTDLDVKLSERAVNVLSVNSVTLDEFASFKYVDFAKLRWSNCQIASELAAASKANPIPVYIKTKTPSRPPQRHHKTSKPTAPATQTITDNHWASAYVDGALPRRAYNTLKDNNITSAQLRCMSEEEMRDLNNVGEKTAADLYKFACFLNNKILAREQINLGRRLEFARDEQLTDILKPISITSGTNTFSRIFDQLKSIFTGDDTECPPISLFPSFFAYLYSIRSHRALFISHNAEAFRLTLHLNYSLTLLSDDEAKILDCFDEVFTMASLSLIGQSSSDESDINTTILEAINALIDKYNIQLPTEGHKQLYKLRTGYESVFASFNLQPILNQVLTEREARIFIKILLHHKSMDEVGCEEGLTRERTRQIYHTACGKIMEHILANDAVNAIKEHNYDLLPYVSIHNSDFQQIKQSEPIDYDFDFFCFILVTIYDGVFNYYDKLKVTPTQTDKITYLCQRKIVEAFDLDKIMLFIQSTYGDPLITQCTINPIFSRLEFRRTKDIPADTIDWAKQFLIFICNDCFDLTVTDADEPYIEQPDNLTPAAIKADISMVLAKSKVPLSPQQIMEALSQMNHTSYSSLSISRLKSYLSDKSLFIPIGKKSLYALASSSYHSGSVRMSVIKILQQSATPMDMQLLTQQVLLLRPDSNEKSVRAVILSMIRSKECSLYHDTLIGLISKQNE